MRYFLRVDSSLLRNENPMASNNFLRVVWSVSLDLTSFVTCSHDERRDLYLHNGGGCIVECYQKKGSHLLVVRLRVTEKFKAAT